MQTNSPILKMVWILFIIILAWVCFNNIQSNFESYYKYDTITKIETLSPASIEFPSLVLCFYPIENFNSNESLYSNAEISFDNFLISCSFNNITCTFDDFVKLEIYFDFKNLTTCYVFNGVENSSRNLSLRSTNRKGSFSGLMLIFKCPVNTTGVYKIAYPYDYPVLSEVDELMSPGFIKYITVKKIIDEKLGEPYNSCVKDSDDENSHESLLFKEIVRSKIRYRQAFCFELCLKKLAVFNSNLTTEKSKLLSYLMFDHKKECSLSLCPLECDSVLYEKNENSILVRNSVLESFLQSQNQTKDDLDKIINLNINY